MVNQLVRQSYSWASPCDNGTGAWAGARGGCPSTDQPTWPPWTHPHHGQDLKKSASQPSRELRELRGWRRPFFWLYYLPNTQPAGQLVQKCLQMVLGFLQTSWHEYNDTIEGVMLSFGKVKKCLVRLFCGPQPPIFLFLFSQQWADWMLTRQRSRGSLNSDSRLKDWWTIFSFLLVRFYFWRD